MKKSKYKNFDPDLILLVFIFMGISCLSIYSAQKFLPYDDQFALKQFIWFIGGMIVTSVVYYFDFEQIKRLSPYLYGVGILLLITLMIAPDSIAPIIKGTKAWFTIPGFGSLQPSEFMKVFLILYLASVIYSHNEKHVDRTLSSDAKLLFKVLLVTALPLALILLQPDAGTAMVITCIMIGMLFISGINNKILFVISGLGIFVIGTIVAVFIYNPDFLLSFMSPYQVDRIRSWLDPFGYGQGIGYQLRLSILASGSGMILGKGYGEGTIAVPEAHSDFIFTVIGEEFGFVGGSVVLFFYFVLLYKIITIVLKNKGEYEILIGIGVVSMLTFHIFENIGMVIGLVPITGIPLPLLSYGGSSVLGTILALSIINNISATTNEYMFAKRE
ncbi:FtsW/RodA/SpoVE family cell cycle protein (plasmid) [Rossellomorea sp. AcN35-11]|nr:rod shape-determining protein RodA [Rossellomorea aquimaris]WJV31929.1 FtsW/RodA/SpoVE family cell cycle protein [Rossellomorea sp. AcN35-11]